MVQPAPRVLLLAGLMVAAAACSDRNPAGPRVSAPERVPPPTHAALQCRMDVRAETLACAPATPETALGVSPLIVGGQGTNVRLTSSGTSWDSTTSILRSSVTVQNLMSEALGTDDGVFPSPEGVRVFFQSGPTVTEGTGTVTVANADGEEVFTAGEQQYFQYAGPLAQGSTTAPREWRFDVPATVTRFVFTVLVSAPVRGTDVQPAAVFLLAGAGLADTVDATPGTMLRIGVRGPDGKPAENIGVQVQTVGVPNSDDREVRVARAIESNFVSTEYGHTDAQGIVEFRVKMGPRAGPGRLIVTALNFSVTDTARYTILPGNAVTMRSLPEDTTVVIGGSAPLRLAVLDRRGNLRSDAIALAVTSGPGSVVGSEVVSGSSIGRIAAVATAAGLSDTSYVGVVPSGTVAAYSTPHHTGQAAALYTFSLDATNVRRVRTSILGAGYFGSMPVDWLSPTRLIYHDNNKMYVHDLETGKAARFLPLRDWMELENHPRVSRDGSWVYFTGGTHQSWSIYRTRSDGTGKEHVPFMPGATEWAADLSPDGERIVFLREGSHYPGRLHIGELATGVARSLDLQGLNPRWSPDGTQIAFVATSDGYHFGGGPAAVVNADGTDARALTLTRFTDIDWSPDGKYVIGAVGDNHLAIIEVATGAEVVVFYPIEGALKAPVWKP